MTISSLPSEKWQQQAVAFLARCRAQMWGKHKEEPLAWMFKAGFTVSFVENALFGWNFRPMNRNAANWLGPMHEGESLFLPPGLVLPWIHEQKVLRLSILKEDGESIVVDGSSMEIMEAGVGRKLILSFADGDFFRILQDLPQGFSLMSVPFQEKILEKDLASYEKILLVSEHTQKREMLLEELQGKGLAVRPAWLPGSTIVNSILEKGLTEERLSPMVFSTV